MGPRVSLMIDCPLHQVSDSEPPPLFCMLNPSNGSWYFFLRAYRGTLYVT